MGAPCSRRLLTPRGVSMIGPLSAFPIPRVPQHCPVVAYKEPAAVVTLRTTWSFAELPEGGGIKRVAGLVYLKRLHVLLDQLRRSLATHILGSLALLSRHTEIPEQ